jgi:hypothetical protein
MLTPASRRQQVAAAGAPVRVDVRTPAAGLRQAGA